MIHDRTDSVALLSQVNSGLKQNRRDHMAHCLDN